MLRTSATLMDLLCLATLSLQAGLAVAQQAPSDAQSPTGGRTRGHQGERGTR